jgi:hypothetical protein
MNKSTTPDQTLKIPKTEAIEKFTKHSAAVRAELAAAKAQLKAAVSPDKYALNFQVNALQKQLNSDKTQINRLKKEPRTEVLWDASFPA